MYYLCNEIQKTHKITKKIKTTKIMKNYRKISPKKLKKLIRNYQSIIKNNFETCKRNIRLSNKYFDLWVEQLELNEKRKKIYVKVFIIDTIIIIVQAILYFIK